MSNQKKLLGMFDALLYSVQDYSSNENIYNDDVKGEYRSFPIPEVEAMREALARLVNDKPPQYITWMRDPDHDSHTKQDAYENGYYTINTGHNLEYWTTVANPFADMPHGFSLDLTTELFIESEYPE